MAGKLYGVSVGPGDPELLTLKAVRVIREADCIAAPNIGHGRQTALQIVWDYIEGKELIDCSTPMVKDHDQVDLEYAKIADRLCSILDQGKNVAFITIGDATVYSTYIYIHNKVLDRGYEAEIVPGVTSFCAAAAKLNISLCQGSESLLVVPVLKGDVDSTLDFPANKVLMKSGSSIKELQQLLDEHGQLDRASMVANCGLPDEEVYENFADMEEPTGYFSTVIVKMEDAE